MCWCQPGKEGNGYRIQDFASNKNGMRRDCTTLHISFQGKSGRTAMTKVERSRERLHCTHGAQTLHVAKIMKGQNSQKFDHDMRSPREALPGPSI